LSAKPWSHTIAAEHGCCVGSYTSGRPKWAALVSARTARRLSFVRGPRPSSSDDPLMVRFAGTGAAYSAYAFLPPSPVARRRRRMGLTTHRRESESVSGEWATDESIMPGCVRRCVAALPLLCRARQRARAESRASTNKQPAPRALSRLDGWMQLCSATVASYVDISNSYFVIYVYSY